MKEEKYVIYTDENGDKSHYKVMSASKDEFLMLLHHSHEFFFMCDKENKGIRFVTEKQYKKSVRQALNKIYESLKDGCDLCINLDFETKFIHDQLKKFNLQN